MLFANKFLVACIILDIFNNSWWDVCSYEILFIITKIRWIHKFSRIVFEESFSLIRTNKYNCLYRFVSHFVKKLVSRATIPLNFETWCSHIISISALISKNKTNLEGNSIEISMENIFTLTRHLNRSSLSLSHRLSRWKILVKSLCLKFLIGLFQIKNSP